MRLDDPHLRNQVSPEVATQNDALLGCCPIEWAILELFNK